MACICGTWQLGGDQSSTRLWHSARVVPSARLLCDARLWRSARSSGGTWQLGGDRCSIRLWHSARVVPSARLLQGAQLLRIYGVKRARSLRSARLWHSARIVFIEPQMVMHWQGRQCACAACVGLVC